MSNRSPDQTRARVANCHPFLKQLGLQPSAVLAILKHPEEYWRQIRGSSGRVYYGPNDELRAVQVQAFMYVRLSRYAAEPDTDHLPFPATAFGKGDSIIVNARYHLKSRSSLGLDLRRAFEQIETKHIQRCLLRWGVQPDASWVLARLLTRRGRLRLGAPTAPALFNLLLGRLDRDLLSVVRSASGMIYTRYGDNLCFSASDDVFPSEFKRRVIETVRRHGFLLNYKKTVEGGNGILEFPGVVIVQGEMRPLGRYIVNLAVRAENGALKNPEVRAGHRSFLNQFGTGGKRRVIEKIFVRGSSPA